MNPTLTSLHLISTGLRSATASSAEAGLQAVDEVADDGEDEKEDDDDDCDGDVAGHFGSLWREGWVWWSGRCVFS
jgi:hypothetical protein